MVTKRQAKLIEDEITYVVRCHSVETIPQLQDALYSIAGQQFPNARALIAIQDLKANDVSIIRAAADAVSKSSGVCVEVKNFKFEASGDHRGALLNRAFAMLRSRYLAILDYDDLVYPNHAATLIEDLKSDATGTIAASFGGCTRAMYDRAADGHIHVTSKKWLSGRASVTACVIENCFPIHSYVLDQKRISKMPQFWEARSVFEDYWFLLHLFEAYPVSTKYLSENLCEYRQNNAAGNTVLPTIEHARKNPEQLAKWEEAGAAITEWKRDRSFKIPYSEIMNRSFPSSYFTALTFPPVFQSVVIYHISKDIRRRLGAEDAYRFLAGPAAFVRKMPPEQKSWLVRFLFRNL